MSHRVQTKLSDISVPFIMGKITSNSKTVVFREFCINMLFGYLVGVSYNIVKLQTCISLHSQVIATLRLSLLSKLLVSYVQLLVNLAEQ